MSLTEKVHEPFINVDEAARFLSMKRLRVVRLARQKRIPAHPFPRGRGNDWFFLKSELAAHMRGDLDSNHSRPFVVLKEGIG